MIEQQILKEKFETAHKGWRGSRTHLCYFITYLLAALICFVLAWKIKAMTWMTHQASWWLLLVPIPFALAFAIWHSRHLRQRLEVARSLERNLPGLDGLLITAEGLLDKPELNVLEQRVVSAATDHAASHDWVSVLTHSRARSYRWLMFGGLLLWVYSFTFMNRRWVAVHESLTQPNKILTEKAKEAVAPTLSVTLTPGDIEIERGARVIVEANFDKDVPADATLVVTELDGQERERIPMRLAVDEQVFGGLISKVEKDARYHVEFGSDQSQEHSITTFVYPALVRADVNITPPAYTGLPPKEIKNTLKISAMEGSELAFTFKINKPIKDAELFGEDKTILPLTPSSADPTTLTTTMKAEKSQKWRLHLVDDKERANKNPPWITVKVQSNQLAKIEVVFPKRDIQVSSLQELPVEAKVWDDLGVTQSGVSFSIAGKSKEVVFKLGTSQPAKKQDVKEMLALENESAEPRQLVSYHFWAEDKGPQGEVRRAMSDMFFADVRHFEDIFREAEPPPSTPGQPEEKGDTDKLVDLQKQIVNATWRIIRDANAGRVMEAAAPDVDVVHESQGLALTQTKEAMEKAKDTEIKTALTEAWKSMKDALDPLEQASAEKKRAPLNQALTFEQSALEWLHRAQSREHRVMRQNQSQSSSSASQKAKENQLMSLELKQEEQRYEEEKQASPEQTAEQQENLQVLNRLKELARRQEALAEKMKELQKQIDKAKTEQEKEELANQLKRLEQEQEQLLRDVDELKDRMENSDNAANMAEAKEQLEQTRKQVMDAAEKLKEQQLADAANAATRAQRELEKMQEDFKEKTAKRFTDEMKQVRQQARQVAEKQKQISEALENQKTNPPSSDTSNDLEKMLSGTQLSRQIEEQAEKVNELLENMRRISEQAEGNNPLLHRRLYEAVRDAQTAGLEENLEEARLQSRYGNRSEAQDAERKATTSVEQLQKGVEKAAESVLGSETEALRMARAELDKLIEEVTAEGKSQEGKAAGKGQEGSANTPVRNESSQASTSPQNTPQGLEGQPGQGEKSGKGTPSQMTQNSPEGSEGQGDEKPGEGQGKGQSGQGSPQIAGGSQGGAGGGSNSGGDDRRRGLPNAGAGFFFDEGAEQVDRSPLTGAGYGEWTDRLRNVEELLNQPELRNEASKVLDNARALRIDHERNDVTPQAENLQMRITQPLVELRDRVAEELAKRNTNNPMVPVDRDPVPPAFRELVKRYYKELGNGN